MADINKQLILQIVISIIFAAAASYLLGVIASLHQLDGFFWFILSAITIGGIIWAISFFLDVSLFPETVDDSVRIAKTGLVVLSALILFAFSRFISFFYDNNISTLNVEDAFRWIWIILLMCGILLGFLTYIEFKTKRGEKNYKSMSAVAAIFIVISAILIYLSSLILQLRGLVI